jgi:hypothetical protein
MPGLGGGRHGVYGDDAAETVALLVTLVIKRAEPTAPMMSCVVASSTGLLSPLGGGLLEVFGVRETCDIDGRARSVEEMFVLPAYTITCYVSMVTMSKEKVLRLFTHALLALSAPPSMPGHVAVSKRSRESNRAARRAGLLAIVCCGIVAHR